MFEIIVTPCITPTLLLPSGSLLSSTYRVTQKKYTILTPMKFFWVTLDLKDRGKRKVTVVESAKIILLCTF